MSLAIIGGVLGIGPAYAGTRLILHLAFQVGGGSLAEKSLVVAHAAMSLVLLSAAALLGQSLRNLEHQNFGFETRGMYIAWVSPLLGNYKPEQMEPMFRQIDDRLLRAAGARMVAPALYALMTGDSWNEGIRIEGRPKPGAKEDTGAGWARVMPGFFDTIGAKIVLGRPITKEDTAATWKVAAINEAFARRFFKNQNRSAGISGPTKSSIPRFTKSWPGATRRAWKIVCARHWPVSIQTWCSMGLTRTRKS
ncbi:MAG: hypothetical protein WB676_05935 [Bryobacteraceae bacterium]